MGIAELIRVLQYRMGMVAWMTAVCIISATGVGLLLPTQYKSTAKVQVDAIQRNNLTGDIEARLRVGEFLGQQAAIVGSRVVAAKVIDTLSEEGVISLLDFEHRWREETDGELVAGNDARLWAADILLKSLEIKADAVESALSISFRSEDRAQAARIANAFADAYMATVIENKKRRFSRNAQNFSDETRSASEEVESAQRQLARFRDDAGLLPLGPDRIEASEVELAAVTQRLAEARSDLSEARALLEFANSSPSEELVNFPIPADLLPARQTQARLGTVIADLTRIRDRYGERYPDYIDAAQERAALENGILRALVDRAAAAAVRVEALEASALELKGEVAAMQRLRDAYSLLERKVASSQGALTHVANRSLEEAMQARTDSIDVVPLARAIPPVNAVTPPLALIIALGGALGLCLGSASAVAVEFREAKVRSADTVRRTLKAPVLGEIALARKLGSRRNRAVRQANWRIAA